MKKSILVLLIGLVLIALAVSSVNAIDSGGINVGVPAFNVGYTSPSWTFQTFEGTPALFNLTVNNLKPADRTGAVVASTLNGTTNVTKTDVTGKNIAILNHVSGFTIYPGTASSPFPSIWVKGNDVNPVSSGADAPTTYLSGTDANKFYQTGLTLQAPYYEPSNYQWTVYVYADKDILTNRTAATNSGRIVDPRTATLRWFAWAAEDSNGIPRSAFGYRPQNATSPIMFNVLPIINSTDPTTIKNLLTSNTFTPETSSELGDLPGISQSAIPANGVVHYNIDRNTASSSNANGLQIIGRSQIGLVYAAPNNALCHRTERLHIQFIAIWPDNSYLGISPGTRSCAINFYQRTAP